MMSLFLFATFLFLYFSLFLFLRKKPFINPIKLHQRLDLFSTPLVLGHQDVHRKPGRYAWIPFYQGWRQRKRQAQCEKQLPDVLDAIARALRAGHSLSVALSLSGEDAAEPLGAEIRTVVDGLRYGRSMEEGLHQLVRNLPQTDMRFVVIAILVHRETGGNLAELLSRVANTLRARFILKGHIESRSAEGKLSAWIMTALPLFLLVWISWATPHAMQILLSDPIGQRLSIAAGMALILGSVWVIQIAEVRA